MTLRKQIGCLKKQETDSQLSSLKYRSTVGKIEIWTCSDASFIIVSGRDYGQTGIIVGQMVTQHDG